MLTTHDIPIAHKMNNVMNIYNLELEGLGVAKEKIKWEEHKIPNLGKTSCLWWRLVHLS
jgi:hypothetical protein